MQTLHEMGVSKKAANVWFKLNENTEIAVKTAGGVSDTAFVGNCIGQGTAGGALVSQANLDHGLEQYFGNVKDQIHYGDVKIQGLAYQDDVLKGNKDALDAQVGNIRMSAMLKEKGLEAHPDKTCFITCGSKSYKQKVKDDLKEHPLAFGDFVMKERVMEKYLGQMLHSAGLEESALATVQEKAGRIRGATMEIKSIVEEYEMQILGGLMAAWQLWERALLPSLLSGAGTWFGDCSKTVELCDDLQNFFWRVILTVPESCPKVALRCETKMMGMKWRIWQEKILLLLRIKGHDKNTLCREVYEEGKKNSWPGLGREVTKICEILDIPDVNDTNMTKQDIKKAVSEHHTKVMMDEVKTKSKLDDIKGDNFEEVQPYFYSKSVEHARMAFKVRTHMVQDIPGNFKNRYKKKGSVSNGLICPHCEDGEEMTQSHCVTCMEWEDIRVGLDMNNIDDLVVFFRKLLLEREKREVSE